MAVAASLQKSSFDSTDIVPPISVPLSSMTSLLQSFPILHISSSASPPLLSTTLNLSATMATALRPASRVLTRPTAPSQVLRQAQSIPSSVLRATASSHFHTSTARYATASGPPPSGFRLPPENKFGHVGLADKTSNYFLLGEMFRGMWILMEQFFRPPYVNITQQSI
jgi:hypothetical protein